MKSTSIKAVRNTALGLLLVFVASSCKGLLHNENDWPFKKGVKKTYVPKEITERKPYAPSSGK